MENIINTKKKKPLFVILARLFFTVYVITLYVFVDKAATVGISRLAFIMYAGFAALVLLQRKRIHLGKNMLIVYTTITWMYATIFWAKNSFYASFTMNTVWQVFLLFFLTYNLFREEEDAHEYFIKSLYIAGIALILYSIKEYGISNVIQMMTLSSKTRLGGEISQANTFGMMNATTVIIAFYYLMYKKKSKILHIAIIASAFLFAMSSGSRKALIMMCIGVLFLVYKKYGIRKLYKIIAVAAVLIFVFMIIIKLPMFNLIGHRLEQAAELLSGEGDGDLSTRVRFRMIIEGWDIFKERLLIGYGANNFAVVSGYGVYAHNNFIEILVDFGLIGFILYYSIYLSALRELTISKTAASKALLSVFVVRLLMEIAMVTYYNKLHWILMAFFLISSRDNSSANIQEAEEDETEEEICEEICEETEVECDEGQEDFEQDEESYCEPEPCVDCSAE